MKKDIQTQILDHLNYHKKFTPEEFESQYNLRLGRPDYEQTVIPQWLERSEAVREQLQCSLDVRYANGEKQMLDLFSCGDAAAPTLMYFHGGYWQRGDKSIYSFLAAPYVANGVNVIIVGYDLCPKVTLTQISQQARQAVAWVYNNASEYSISASSITVMGHSAGGHITEMMMGTDWSAFADGMPQNLVKAGIPISPLSMLEPVRLTVGLNTGIRMDEAEAEAESPMLNHHPVTNAPQLVVVGGAETDEFHRQAQMYVDAFSSDQRPMEMYVVPGVDHFDELNILSDTGSEFFNKTLTLVSSS